jgi:hypothetical protein
MKNKKAILSAKKGRIQTSSAKASRYFQDDFLFSLAIKG